MNTWKEFTVVDLFNVVCLPKRYNRWVSHVTILWVLQLLFWDTWESGNLLYQRSGHLKWTWWWWFLQKYGWPPQKRCEGVPFYSQLWLLTSVCSASLSTYGTLTCCQHSLYCARDTLIGCCELLKPLCDQILKTVILRFLVTLMAQWNPEILHEYLKLWTETLLGKQINTSFTGDCVPLSILLTVKIICK